MRKQNSTQKRHIRKWIQLIMWTRFKVWQQFGGQWAKAGVYIKTKVHNMKHGGGVKAWKTLAQLEQHYHCPITAAAVCKQLTDSGKWRPNPDAPQCEAAIEYWAHLREDEAWRKTTETETVFAFEAELGPDALKLIDNDWLEIAADCFHDTSSSAAGPARAAAGQHSIDDIRAEARQAEREKIEAEQQERDLAMLEAKERAKDEKKRRREEEKNAPLAQAKKWASGVQVDITKFVGIISGMDNETVVAESVRTEWITKFQTTKASLERLKQDLDCCTEDNALALVAQANSLVMNAKQQKKDWAGLVRQFKKIAPGASAVSPTCSGS